jgi:hypothetical protein
MTKSKRSKMAFETKLRKLYTELYKFHHRGRLCYYCGDKADSTDHVPALIEVYRQGTEYFATNNIKLVKVTCCRLCNELSATRGYTLEEKSKIIYTKYRDRFDPLFKSGMWTEDELNELGPVLRSAIENYSTVRNWLERKMIYMEDMFYDVL